MEEKNTSVENIEATLEEILRDLDYEEEENWDMEEVAHRLFNGESISFPTDSSDLPEDTSSEEDNSEIVMNSDVPFDESFPLLKEITIKDKDIVELLYSIGGYTYDLMTKYQVGMMEFLYHLDQETVAEDLHIFDKRNNQVNEIKNIEEFREKLEDESDIRNIVEKIPKKFTIRLKKDVLYLDVDYTYKYKTENGKIRNKTYKLTYDPYDYTGNLKLLAYFAEDLGYTNLAEFIKDARIVKFRRNAYQAFMNLYGDFINNNEIQTKNENEKEAQPQKTEKNKISKEERKNPIGKIVFFQYEENGKNIIKAVIFNKDGSYKTVSEKEADIYIDILKRLLNKDEATLVKEGYIENNILEEQKLVKNIEKYQKEASKPSKKRLFKNKKKAALITTALVAVTAIITTTFIGLKSWFKKDSSSPKEDAKKQEDIKTPGNTKNKIKSKNKTEQEKIIYDYSNCSWNKMIEYCRPNKDRMSLMSRIKEYLSQYNGKQANQYKEEKNEVKAAQKFKEGEAYYLACNKMDPEQIYQYFGNHKIKKESLMKNLKRAINQNARLHNIQNETLDVNSDLLNGETAKKRYTAYDKKFVSINTTSNVEKKIEYIEQVYDMFRKDLPNINNNSYEGVKGSTAVIITEFAQALENITGITVKNGLNVQEKYYIDHLLENVIANKFKNIENKLIARIIAEKNYPSTIETEVVPTYRDMMEQMTKTLQEKGLYQINQEERNITTYNSYKKNTNLKMPENMQKITRTENKGISENRVDPNIVVSSVQIEQARNESQEDRQQQIIVSEENKSLRTIEDSKAKTTQTDIDEQKKNTKKDQIGELVAKADQLVQIKDKEVNNFVSIIGDLDKESDIFNTEEDTRIDLDEVEVEDIDTIVDNNQQDQDVIQNNLPQYSVDDIEEQYVVTGQAIQTANLVNKEYLLSIANRYVDALENYHNNEEKIEKSYHI